MNTVIKYNEEARLALKKGVDAVANAVKVSLGAEGRNVIIPVNTHQGIRYIITKDGVSIARSIDPSDEYEKIGASMIKEAARRTNNYAGDGTTTATIIAQSIFEQGLSLITKDEKISSVGLKKGIDQATEDIVAYLDKVSTKVSKSNLANVATISANGDEELGKIIATAFNKIGKHGTVISEVSDTADTYVEMRDGVQLDRGFYHSVFVTDRIKEVCELENTFVLLHRGKLEKGDAVVNLFKQVFSKQGNRLLIITDDIDPFVLSTMVQNVRDGAIRDRACVVKTPQILKIEKELMSDIATLTGAKVVSEVDGVKLRPEVLGRLKKAIISEKETLLIGDADNLTDLVAELNEKIRITKNEFDKKELQERLARITGGVATLYVGAKSDSELKEKQDRIEDSINATRSALEEGIVPGGGVALLQAAGAVAGNLANLSGAVKQGYQIVLDACGQPSRQMSQNAGLEFRESPVLNEGINVKTGEMENMIEAGIIDPKKVTRCAVENAASVAGTFLTTEAIVAIER